jgi:hypothetical protein
MWRYTADMLWMQLTDVLVGFVVALPFVGIRRYGVRVVLSATLVLGLFWMLNASIRSHGSYWDDERAFRLTIGALLAAHLRTLWLFVRTKTEGRSAE